MTPELIFEGGTLRLDRFMPEALPEDLQALLRYDERSKVLRARACDYAPIVLGMRAAGIHLEDRARAFDVLETTPVKWFEPRPHQEEAYAAWRKNDFRGVAALPTGAGKTFLAVMAIARLRRTALVLVPTIDLLQQWSTVLEGFFGTEIGMLGGGEHKIAPITVSTYDSAVLQMEFIGNRFCLLIADECHHLPGPVYQLAPAMCIAPYRLGLSATPEQEADREAVMDDLLGPLVCHIHIDELEGTVLSPYETRRIEVVLDDDELEEYTAHRARYTDFLRRNRLSFRDSGDWGRFLGLCARLPEGKEVLRSFLLQRRIARGSRAKIAKLWEIVSHHCEERILIFTADNATAYAIGREFCWPVLTHHTGLAERKEFLASFRTGEYPVLVTSKVLNEGVDVPAAGVAIVLSGSGSVREHVQRLGRILRPAPGKERAVLYELLSANTAEFFVSERRRKHRAYR